MNVKFIGWMLILTILGITLGMQAAEPVSSDRPHAASKVRLIETYASLPLSFESNVGQTDSQVQFLARGLGYGLYLTSSEALLALRNPATNLRNNKLLQSSEKKTRENGQSSTTLLRMRLIGASPKLETIGLEELTGKVNYFRGNSPKGWHTNIPIYAKVRYENVYPGIDLIYYGNQRQLEYDFVVAPEADPSLIKFAFKGADNPEIDPHGDLLLRTAGGEVRLRKPVVYQEIEGDRRELDGQYVLDVVEGTTDKLQVGFQVATYDSSQPLVIDPVIIYSTYLGGSNSDGGLAIAVDNAGNSYVVGATSSVNFPVLNAFQDTFGGGFIPQDAFVIKLDPAGQPIYSTYLGGSGTDGSLVDITVDGLGNTYVRGNAPGASNFPLVNAFNVSAQEGAFIAKLDSDGQVVYSTFLGNMGTGTFSKGRTLAVDQIGNAYVTGFTNSPNFPVVNAFDSSLGGVQDGFVTKLDPFGQPIYSTFLGGDGPDSGFDIAVDGIGNAYVTGRTQSSNFPVMNAFDDSYNDDSIQGDSFVTKFSPEGEPIYSTYLGGTSSDAVLGIAVDSDGNAVVTGSTSSTDFPLVNAFDSSFTSKCIFRLCTEGFLTKFDSNGQVVYSTFLGGSGDDLSNNITVDSEGNVIVNGSVAARFVEGGGASTDFPVVNAFNPDNTGGGDQFVAKFDPIGQAIYSSYVGGNNNFNYGGVNLATDTAGNAYLTGSAGNDALVIKLNPIGELVYSLLLGGTGTDLGLAIATDDAGNAYVTGVTSSLDFPIENPFQVVYGGGLNDAFVAKISNDDGVNVPSVSLSNTSLAFGNQFVGTASATQTVTASNNGSGDLVLGALTLTGTNSGDYALAGDSCSGQTLVTNENCTFEVTFTPTATGERLATVNILSNDLNSPHFITLSGIGVLVVDDTDMDSISDTQDACPNEPEDFDGFQDNDGCPESAGGLPGVNTTPTLEELAFFVDVERPPLQKVQFLGFRLGPFTIIDPDAPLWRGVLDVLKSKEFDGSGSDCEVAAWASGADVAGERFVVNSLGPIINSVISGGIHIAFAPYTFASKVLIREALILGIGLTNDALLGNLEASDIPIESTKTLVRITIGYMMPLLTKDYFEEKLTELALRGISDTLLEQLIQREKAVIINAKGENIRRRDLPHVETKLGLVYSPYTHFSTLFVRSGGDGCNPNTVYILRYEVDKDGLLIGDGVVPHIIVPLE